MSYTSGDDNLSRFLDQAQKAIANTHGVNAQSLPYVIDLAARLELSREEMEAAGAQLGLNSAEVRRVIDEAGLEGESGSGGGALRWVMVLGSLAIILGVGSGVAFFLMNRPQEATNPPPVAQNGDNNKPGTKPATEGNTNNSGQNGTNTVGGSNGQNNENKNGGNSVTPAIPPPPATINDPELKLAVDRLEAQLPAEKSALDKLRLTDAAQRHEGWQQFLPRLGALMAEKESLRPLLVSFHAKDERDDNADLIRGQVLKFLPPHVSSVPEKAAVYDQAYWALDVVTGMLDHGSLPPDRKQKLLKDLEGVLNVKFDAGMSAQEVKKQAGKALSELFFGELIKSARTEPDRAAVLQDALGPPALAYLGLDKLGELGGRLKDAIKGAKDPPPVNPEPNPNPPVKPVDPTKTANTRLDNLVNTATILLKKPQPPKNDPVVILQDTVNLAYATTLAVALANKNNSKFDELATNPPTLSDYLAKVKPPEKPKVDNPPANPPQPNPGAPGAPGGFPPPNNPGAGMVGFGGNPMAPGGFQGAPGAGMVGFGGGAVGFGGSPAAGFMGNAGGAVGFTGNPGAGFVGNVGGNQPGGNPNPPANPVAPFSDAENLSFALRVLKTNQSSAILNSQLALARLKSLDFVANGLGEPDLNPFEAESVAVYLMTSHAKEFEGAIPMLPKLGRFKGLYLAIADLVPETTVQVNRMEVLLTALTGKQVNLSHAKDWRQECRQLMLRTALTMGETLPEGDAVQLILRDLYVRQAGLMGLDVSTTADRPTEVLEMMIKGLAAHLDQRKDLSLAQKKLFKSVPNKLAAARYLVGDNDVRLTVLFQRQWINLLAEKLALERPDRAKQARDLTADLAARGGTQANALAQMWLCDQCLLRLWLLHLEPAPQAAKKNEAD
jgi:hypothetical protein